MTYDFHNNNIYIFGNGGHARVIADIIRTSTQFTLAEFIDRDEEDHFIQSAPEGTLVCVALGENSLRRKCAQKLQARKFQFPNLISASAVIAPDVKMGHGNVFMPGAIINPASTIGSFCVFNTGSILEHDCHVEDYASLAPAAVVCGNCDLDEGVYVGANATLSHGLKIRKWSALGAGAVAISDIEPNAIYAGNPARFIKSKSYDDCIL